MNLFCRAILLKLFLFSCFTIFSTVVFSQERTVTLGVKGGMSLNSNGSNSSIIGGRIGVAAEIPCSKRVSIQPALFFAAKGGNSHTHWKITTTPYGSTQEQTTDINRKWSSKANYIEMPVEVLFHIPFHTKGRGLQLSVGPYFAAAVGGKTTYTKEVNFVQTKHEKYDTFSKDGMDLKKYDIGAVCEIHFELGRFLIGNYIEFSLIPLKGNDIYDYAIGKKNISLGIDFGYKF